MIEVFKTDVTDIAKSSAIIKLLTAHIPGGCINFDLDDCDNILRVQGECFCVETVILLLKNTGHYCELLED
jgi:hypothetical protein